MLYLVVKHKVSLYYFKTVKLKFEILTRAWNPSYKAAAVGASQNTHQALSCLCLTSTNAEITIQTGMHLVEGPPPTSVADPGFPVGRGAWTSNAGAFHQKCV